LCESFVPLSYICIGERERVFVQTLSLSLANITNSCRDEFFLRGGGEKGGLVTYADCRKQHLEEREREEDRRTGRGRGGEPGVGGDRKNERRREEERDGAWGGC